jgi:hypothetical protein
MVDERNKTERKTREEDGKRNDSCSIDGTVLVGDNKEASKQESCRERSFHDTVVEHPLPYAESYYQILDNSIPVVSFDMVVMDPCTQASSLIKIT